MNDPNPEHPGFRRIEPSALERLVSEAQDRSRGRTNLNLHPELTDPIQRFCNILTQGSYVRPHRHEQPPRWELFVGLEGRVAILGFDDHGTVRERIELGPETTRIVEIPAGAWHSLTALTPSAVLFELKPGPYTPLTDKDFAAWAPREGDAAAPAFTAWMRTARPGDPAPAVPR